METGEVYNEKRVWHKYDGAGVTHWNTEHVRDKYSVIVHNNKTGLKMKKIQKLFRYSAMCIVYLWERSQYM